MKGSGKFAESPEKYRLSGTFIYPLWSEDLDEEPTREEIEEIVLAPRPVALTDLLAEISKAPALKRLRRAQHIAVGYDLSAGDITGLARVGSAGEYAALGFDGAARLLRFEPDLIMVLTAGDAVASVTSRSRTRSIPRCPPYGMIAR
jgi:hypothetical protein